MAVLPPMSSPAGAWRDLRAFLATREKHHFLFGGLAILMPAIILVGFYIDSDPGPPPVKITYVQNYNGDRPDSVIVAQQKIDQAEKDRQAEARREAYRRIAKATGIE